jgi:hypothetical protein
VNTTSYSIPSGVLDGLLLIRIQADTGSVPPSAVKWNGATLAAMASVSTSDGGYMQTWWMLAPASGAHALEVDSTDGYQGHSWNVEAVVYGGVNQGSPFGASASGLQGSSASWVDTITTQYADSLVDDYLEIENNPHVFTMGNGQVLLSGWCGGGNSVNRGDYMAAPVAGRQNLTYGFDVPKAGAYSMLEIRGAGSGQAKPALRPGLKGSPGVLDAGPSLVAAPNPCRDHVNFAYRVDRAGMYRLVVVNLVGESVVDRPLGSLGPGRGSVGQDVSRLADGIYMAWLLVDDGSGWEKCCTMKIAVLK